MRLLASILLCAALLATPLAAFARNTEVLLPASGAVASDRKGHLLSTVKFFLKGQKHPAVAKELLTVSTNRATRGAFRSDEASCHVAFLSVMRSLQDRALEEGADGIINIVSVTREKKTESASDFRCVAGTAVVHVGLRGTLVKLR